MSRSTRLVAGGATSVLALAGVLVATSPAGADPVNRNTSLSTVECADGSTYHVTAVDRSSRWSPGLDLDSTTVLVPVAWGDAHIELRSPVDGSLIGAFDEPWAATKGAGTQPGALSCVIHNESTEDIPPHGETVVSVTIPVQLLVR